MFVKTCISIAITFALTFTPALAKSHVFDVPGPSLVVLETTGGGSLTLEENSDFLILEESTSHVVLAATKPIFLVGHSPEEAEVVATITRVRVVEQEAILDDTHVVVRRLFVFESATKEEDHDFDPDPKRSAKRPLVTLLTLQSHPIAREEDHDFDPDPKRRPLWSNDWAILSAAVLEFGPGWYFGVRHGEVSSEILAEKH